METISSVNEACKKNINGLSKRRFDLIQHCLEFNNAQIHSLTSLFSDISYDLVKEITIAAVDETVYSYTLRSETKKKYVDEYDKAPVVCIPRKPHPNGLLSYMVATYLKGGFGANIVDLSDNANETPRRRTPKNYPFVFEFIPKITNDVSATSCIQHIIGTFANGDFHIVGDSAFCSKDIMEYVRSSGWSATLSDSSQSDINILLKDILVNDDSWVAVEMDGYYKVCKIVERENDKVTYKIINTTGFYAFDAPPPQAKDFTQDDAKAIYQLGKSLVVKLCNLAEVDVGGSFPQIVKRLTGINPLTISSGENIYERIENLIENDELKSLSLKVIKDLYGELQIPTPKGNKKIDYINALVDYISRDSTHLQGKLDKLRSSIRSSIPLPINLYKTWFNTVDLHDKYLYQGGLHGHIKRWRPFYVSALFKSYIVNIYSYYMSISREHIKYKSFKKKLVNQLRVMTKLEEYYDV